LYRRVADPHCVTVRYDRAVDVPDSRLRQRLRAALDDLCGLQENEALRKIDTNALLQSLAEDAAVLGKAISADGLALTPYTGHLSALRRALQNLIDNALKYGHRAALRIEDDAATLRLIVDDEGQGIPPAEPGRVTEPYYRPDASRSRETGGVERGLSIARDIALLHGDELLLANRGAGGLCTTQILPRMPKN